MVNAMPLLFSYGTLRDEAVQRATFGRKLEGSPDELVGFESEGIEIEEEGAQAKHVIVRANGRSDSRVSGVALEVAEEDLALADRHEPAPYVRISITLASGRQAWVYADTRDRWAAATAYEDFMGRWSRRIARRFVPWLRVPAGAHWLDVGCGTGALTAAICDLAEPATVLGCDPSPAFVDHARAHARDARASFVVAGAGGLPPRAQGYGCIASSFALNFLPDPRAAVHEMRSLAASGGAVGACVWDYAEGMEFLRFFWDAAAEVSTAAKTLDEGKRFPLCQPGALDELFREAGLSEVRCEPLEIQTVFASFEDYWRPMLGGTGPAPSFVSSLDADRRTALASKLEAALPRAPDGSIALAARAWAVRGTAS
jgi:SAM-dependent methyltransferase